MQHGSAKKRERERDENEKPNTYTLSIAILCFVCAKLYFQVSARPIPYSHDFIHSHLLFFCTHTHRNTLLIQCYLRFFFVPMPLLLKKTFKFRERERECVCVCEGEESLFDQINNVHEVDTKKYYLCLLLPFR